MAHLPLVAPGHPDLIASAPGTDYESGRYAAARRSLAVPVPWQALEMSEPFRAMDAALRRSRAAPKVDWGLVHRRRDRLHVTLAAGLTAAELPDVTRRVGAAFGAIRPFALRVGGPLLGDRNRGRIYLACYPERVSGGADPLALLQDAAGRPRTGLYLVGLYNLTDHLDTGETAGLADVLARFALDTLAEVWVDRLWLIETSDDLALSTRVAELRPA